MEVHNLQGNRQSGAKWSRQQPPRPGSNDQPHRTGSNDQKQIKSKRESCFNCGVRPSHPRIECPANKAKCFKCGKEGHYSSVCRSKSKDVRVNELQVQSPTTSKSVDCVLMNISQFTSMRLFITLRQ